MNDFIEPERTAWNMGRRSAWDHSGAVLPWGSHPYYDYEEPPIFDEPTGMEKLRWRQQRLHKEQAWLEPWYRAGRRMGEIEERQWAPWQTGARQAWSKDLEAMGPAGRFARDRHYDDATLYDMIGIRQQLERDLKRLGY